MNAKVKSVLRSILNFNYHTCALSVYIVASDRRQMLPVARRIQAECGGGMLSILSKMALSNLVTGCNFWEYYNLRFFLRSMKNQNSFLTTYFNSVFFHRNNSYKDQELLYNKALFNERFQKFRCVHWCDLDGNITEIKEFLRNEREIIVKPKRGECGHGVFTINTADIPHNKIEAWIKEHSNMVCEDIIGNHPDISRLNRTSLNTIRIITYLSSDMKCHIIWSGIRIGKDGSCVDNISEGGSCCSVDIDSGKITSLPLNEHGEVMKVGIEETRGYQLPYWEETKSFIANVAKELPSMKFIAWDIAITPNGPVLIEGNHEVSNTISQVHIPINENGLRNRLLKCVY